MARTAKRAPAPVSGETVRFRVTYDDCHLGDGRVLLKGDVADLPAEIAAACAANGLGVIEE